MKRVLRALMLLAVLGAGVLCPRAALGQSAPGSVPRERPPPANLRALDRLSVPIGNRTLTVRVETPDSRRSLAWPEGAGRKPGQAEPAPAGRFLELTDELIVRFRGDGRLDDLRRAHGVVTARRLEGLPGYALLSAGSVRAALQLAQGLTRDPRVLGVELSTQRPLALRSLPSDPKFNLEWHLHNALDPLFDANAEGAWNLGYTGAGVLIGILDTPIQGDHPDLLANFDPNASQPLAGPVASHGTEVAGVAVAAGNNGRFGAGLAYHAHFGRQILGTDAQNAEGLAFRGDIIDIRNNSWGPSDNGQAHVLPAVLLDAIEQGVRTGRGGRGTVYVWAAGNGGIRDRVEYDPLAASRYTLAVGAIGDLDVHAPYSEEGSSLLLVAHSSGNVRGIYTVRPGGDTQGFGGTSAACPVVSGAVALMLEADPRLHWRDVRKILVDSARRNDANDPSWTVNAAGRDVSYIYGFGAVDAGAAVALAENWSNLPHEVAVDTGMIAVNADIPDSSGAGHVVDLMVDENIRIEAIELFVNVQSTFIGDLQIQIERPDLGTRSILARRRPFDDQDDYVDYRFTTFRHFGETSAGPWRVKVSDRAAGDLAHWQDFRLVFYGVPICPGDLNESGVYDIQDLEFLLAAFGFCEDQPAFDAYADLDGSGCTDLDDLTLLLRRFGRACD